MTRKQGDPPFYESPRQEALLTEIVSTLRAWWPDSTFTYKRVERKVEAMVRVWRAFIALDLTDVSYDHDTGAIGASDEKWAGWMEKYGEPIYYLRRSGFPRKNLYQKALEGSEEFGLTAVPAWDVEGLNAIELVSCSGDEYKGHSRAPATNRRPSSAQSRASTSRTSSRFTSRTIRMTEPRPPRAPEMSVNEVILSLLVSHSFSRRRSSFEANLTIAMRDVQTWFASQTTYDEMSAFFDSLQARPLYVHRYLGSTEFFKRRMFWSVQARPDPAPVSRR